MQNITLFHSFSVQEQSASRNYSLGLKTCKPESDVRGKGEESRKRMVKVEAMRWCTWRSEGRMWCRLLH